MQASWKTNDIEMLHVTDSLLDIYIPVLHEPSRDNQFGETITTGVPADINIMQGVTI